MEEWSKKWEEIKKREMGQKTEEGVAVSAKTVGHQSTGLECSQWILRVLLVSLALLWPKYLIKNTLRKVVLACGLGRVHFLVICLHALSRPSSK